MARNTDQLEAQLDALSAQLAESGSAESQAATALLIAQARKELEESRGVRNSHNKRLYELVIGGIVAAAAIIAFYFLFLQSAFETSRSVSALETRLFELRLEEAQIELLKTSADYEKELTSIRDEAAENARELTDRVEAALNMEGLTEEERQLLEPRQEALESALAGVLTQSQDVLDKVSVASEAAVVQTQKVRVLAETARLSDARPAEPTETPGPTAPSTRQRLEATGNVYLRTALPRGLFCTKGKAIGIVSPGEVVQVIRAVPAKCGLRTYEFYEVYYQSPRSEREQRGFVAMVDSSGQPLFQEGG
ncbi:MAG: hypothetical protein AAGG11_17565 [Pseudomonadota bacterium]